eukprot:364795-Chlamydomonas_euryale.AAC.11
MGRPSANIDAPRHLPLHATQRCTARTSRCKHARHVLESCSKPSDATRLRRNAHHRPNANDQLARKQGSELDSPELQV